MKQRNVKRKINETLPPHLAKLVDKDGDFTPEVKARLTKGGEDRLKSTKPKFIDRTPKGYGPTVEEDTDADGFTQVDKDTLVRTAEEHGAQWIRHTGEFILDGEVIGYMAPHWISDEEFKKEYYLLDDLVPVEEEVIPQVEMEEELPPRTSIMLAMREEREKAAEGFHSGGEYYTTGDPNYLMVEVIAGRPGTRWSIMNYKDTPGSNPLNLRKELNDHAKEIGFQGYDVVAQWIGDLDDVLGDTERKLALGKNWTNSVKYALKSKVKSLTNAKQVMTGEEVGTVKEAKPTSSDYAIGMAQAKKSANDNPPLQKSTIKKAHKIAKAVANEGSDQNSAFAQRPIHVLMQEIERVLPDFEPYGAKEKLLDKIDRIMYQPTEIEEERKIGDKVKYRNIKTKRNKTGTVRKTEKKPGGTRYELDSGAMVYDQDLEEAMPPVNKEVIIAYKGKKISTFKVPYNAKIHHIDQELRKLEDHIPLRDFERTTIARELARGKIARTSGFAFKIQDDHPKEIGLK